MAEEIEAPPPEKLTPPAVLLPEAAPGAEDIRMARMVAALMTVMREEMGAMRDQMRQQIREEVRAELGLAQGAASGSDANAMEQSDLSSGERTQKGPFTIGERKRGTAARTDAEEQTQADDRPIGLLGLFKHRHAAAAQEPGITSTADRGGQSAAQANVIHQTINVPGGLFGGSRVIHNVITQGGNVETKGR